MPEEVDITLHEMVRKIYDAAEPVVQEHVQRMGTTCIKGCDHCCYLFVSCTFMEAAYLAEIILTGWDDVEGWIDRLAEKARKMAEPGMTSRKWFEKHEPCVFLKDHACTIYDDRPEPCRYHYVVSNPRYCSSENPDTPTAQIDLRGAADVLFKANFEFIHRMNLRWLAGPMPFMILWAMYWLLKTHGLQKPEVRPLRKKVGYALQGLPTPDVWLRRTPLSEEKRGKKMPPEEVERLRR